MIGTDDGKDPAPALSPGDPALDATRSLHAGDPEATQALKPADSGGNWRDRPLAHDKLPIRFGEYELLNEIAKGGMGVVYKARQVGLNRLVAVKMILSGAWATRDELARFLLEAEAAANLQHPNIVGIHEIGQHAGQHFFSMEYVDGVSLAQLARREQTLSAHRAAGYVEVVARAIEFAHRRGILHRDIKPSNILVDHDDQPKVTDFGLAKRTSGDSGLTDSGAVLGTPSYMPPEQAQGLQHEVGPASDVYSLGAVLYELLTGRPPFRAESVVETVLQVVTHEPVSPRQLNPKVPRDLETVCLKCLEKQPARRYATAYELAEELRRFRAAEPIAARPVGRGERVLRWARRNPRVAAPTAVAALLLLLVAIGLPIMLYRVNAARIDANANAEHAGQAVDELRDLIRDWFAHANQTDAVQRELLEQALRFHERFLEQDFSNPDGRYLKARSYLAVGDICRLLGQAEKSERAYREAVGRLEGLAGEFPRNRKYGLALARNHTNLGWLLSDAGRREGALIEFDLAISRLDLLSSEAPSEQPLRYELGRAHYNRGIAQAMDVRRRHEAKGDYDLAVQLLSEAVRSDPDAEAYQEGLAHALLDRGVLTGSDDDYRLAVEQLERLRERSPTRREYRFVLAVARINRGNRLAADGHVEAARASQGQAIEALERLVADYPGVPDYRKELGVGYNSLGSSYFDASPGEAFRSWELARGQFERLSDEFPTSPEYHHLLGVALGNLALLQIDGERSPGLEEAVELLSRAVAESERAHEANPLHTLYNRNLRDLYDSLADALIKLAASAEPQSAAEAKLRAARCLARWLELANDDTAVSGAQRSEVADDAIELLQNALQFGAVTAAELHADPKLAPLRQSGRFAQILAAEEGGRQGDADRTCP